MKLEWSEVPSAALIPGFTAAVSDQRCSSTFLDAWTDALSSGENLMLDIGLVPGQASGNQLLSSMETNRLLAMCEVVWAQTSTART